MFQASFRYVAHFTYCDQYQNTARYNCLSSDIYASSFLNSSVVNIIDTVVSDRTQLYAIFGNLPTYCRTGHCADDSSINKICPESRLFGNAELTSMIEPFICYTKSIRSTTSWSCITADSDVMRMQRDGKLGRERCIARNIFNSTVLFKQNTGEFFGIASVIAHQCLADNRRIHPSNCPVFRDQIIQYLRSDEAECLRSKKGEKKVDRSRREDQRESYRFGPYYVSNYPYPIHNCTIRYNQNLDMQDDSEEYAYEYQCNFDNQKKIICPYSFDSRFEPICRSNEHSWVINPLFDPTRNQSIYDDSLNLDYKNNFIILCASERRLNFYCPEYRSLIIDMVVEEEEKEDESSSFTQSDTVQEVVEESSNLLYQIVPEYKIAISSATTLYCIRNVKSLIMNLWQSLFF